MNKETSGYDFVLVKSEEGEPGDVRLNDLHAENGRYDLLLIPVFDVVELVPEYGSTRVSCQRIVRIHSLRLNPSYPPESSIAAIVESVCRVMK